MVKINLIEEIKNIIKEDENKPNLFEYDLRCLVEKYEKDFEKDKCQCCDLVCDCSFCDKQDEINELKAKLDEIRDIAEY